jgi:hypothetical protein
MKESANKSEILSLRSKGNPTPPNSGTVNCNEIAQQAGSNVSFRNPAIIGLIGVVLGAFIGYSLNFEPDFKISLNSQMVNIDRNATETNKLIIVDKCPDWLRGIKCYDNQIYPRIDNISNGLTIIFTPRSINTLKYNSRETIELEINAPGSIEPGSYLVYIDVYGADTKKKTCMMEIIVVE